jgi:CCR4-NOT transcription complex subunit 6
MDVRCSTSETSEGSPILAVLRSLICSHRYALVEHQVIEFRNIAMSRPDFKKSQDLFSRFTNRDHIAVVCLFESKATGTRTIVANTHLFWDATYRDVKLVQVGLLAERLQEIADGFAKLSPRILNPNAEDGSPVRHGPVYTDGSRIPLVLCGDFNSVPGSGVYEFLANGFIPASHADWLRHSYGRYTDEGVRHRLGLKNAYGGGVELAMTNYTPSFQGVLDYVWYSGQNLALNAVLGEVDKTYLEKQVGFPNANFPSE